MKDTMHIFIPALNLLTSQEISQQFHMFNKERKMLEPRAAASQDYLGVFWDERIETTELISLNSLLASSQ